MIEYVQSFSIVAALVSLLIALYTNKKRLDAQAFIAYTSKYDNLEIHVFSEWSEREERTFESTNFDQKLGLHLHKYLHLCCQQYYLYTKGMISKSVWDIWQPELESNISTLLVKTYWCKHCEDFQFYPAFTNYVDRVAAERSN